MFGCRQLPTAVLFGVFRRGNKPPGSTGGREKGFSEDKNGELEASRKLHGIMKAVWHRKTMEEKMKDKTKSKVQHIQSTDVNITSCLRRNSEGKKYTGN